MGRYLQATEYNKHETCLITLYDDIAIYAEIGKNRLISKFIVRLGKKKPKEYSFPVIKGDYEAAFTKLYNKIKPYL